MAPRSGGVRCTANPRKVLAERFPPVGSRQWCLASGHAILPVLFGTAPREKGRYSTDAWLDREAFRFSR